MTQEHFPTESICHKCKTRESEKLDVQSLEDKSFRADSVRRLEDLIAENMILEIINNLDQFQGLNHDEIVHKLLNAGKSDLVVEHFRNFKGLNHNKIALEIVEDDGGDVLAMYLENFEGLDYNEIARGLIRKGDDYSLALHLEKFQNLNPEIAHELIKVKEEGPYVAKFLESFTGLDHNEIAYELINAGNGNSVAEHFSNFKDVDHNEIALKLIECGNQQSLLEYIQNFNDFSYNSFEKMSPDKVALYEQSLSGVGISMDIFRNIRIFLSLYSYILKNPEHIKNIIRKHPFLLDAIESNTRFGTKLLTTFPKFDILAQDEISTLYRHKKDILAVHPNIDIVSVEFRMLMQDRLKDFKNNASILKFLTRYGIDVKRWLAFDEEKVFDLGKEDDIPFSAQIKSPIKRIDTSLGKYFEHVTIVLGEYKDILTQVEVPSDKESELRTNLKEMRAKQDQAKFAGDSKKVFGIGKGIANLEQGLTSLKPSTAWNKLRGDMNNFGMLVKGMTAEYELLQVLEEEVRTATNRKKMIALKDKIAKVEDTIKEKIAKVDCTLSIFQTTFGEILGVALSEHRRDAVVQEIMETFGEDFDHYRTDLSTVSNLLEKSESSFEGTPMRLSIASRDPDIDLYLGNYCPCCVRIDSDIHRAESPISDFVTDLGMHNVVVYDEKRMKPVVVAWCFAGYNKEDNDPFLIVDNVEADTSYSAPFRSQLEMELKEYITRFAVDANIRADHIIQGPHNNDLEVFPLREIDAKIGGYNRHTGYYLEAERD